jgi:hypothetical protein
LQLDVIDRCVELFKNILGHGPGSLGYDGYCPILRAWAKVSTRKNRQRRWYVNNIRTDHPQAPAPPYHHQPKI